MSTAQPNPADPHRDDGPPVGIAQMAQACRLSADTLRWYEKEGMLPAVHRGPDGRRRYSPRDRDLVLLLAALRDTGMPTALMKEFVALVAEGAASHGRRIGVLAQTRDLLEQRRSALESAMSALDAKIAHYEELIAAGLDCDAHPVTDEVRAQQRSTRRRAAPQSPYPQMTDPTSQPESA